MRIGDEPIHPIEGAANAYSFSGITLRQHYAGLAIQGLANESGRYHSPEDMAHDAVKIADALLAELEKQNEA